MVAVDIIKINVSHCRGLNIYSIRLIRVQMASPNDCDMIKLTERCDVGLEKAMTNAIAVQIIIV